MRLSNWRSSHYYDFSTESNMDCYTGLGREFMSSKYFQTESGITCQAWDSQTPHAHLYSYVSTSNYCTNPDKGPKPWCYTTDPDVRWEYCNIPYCPGRSHQSGCCIFKKIKNLHCDVTLFFMYTTTMNIESSIVLFKRLEHVFLGTFI